MSTWTDVTDTVLEPGQPIRSVDIIALKNNIIAVPGGAANAPRVQTAAIQDLAVTSAKLATGTNERNWVLARTAGASAGAVGTYAFLGEANSTSIAVGSTYAGSRLRYAGIMRSAVSWATNDNNQDVRSRQHQVVTPAGTWRCMGSAFGGSADDITRFPASLFLRIS
jgi:hypothetical protein